MSSCLVHWVHSRLAIAIFLYPCLRKTTHSRTHAHTHTHISFDADSKPGDLVYYGQHISFTTLPNEGGQVSTSNNLHTNQHQGRNKTNPPPANPSFFPQLNLQTDRATFMKHSKHTREQHVTLEDELSYKSAWYVLVPS